MNSDFYFAMGKSHMICQDYAYAGENAKGNPVAVVSDGCSSSPESDFGARFLVRSAVICGATVGDFLVSEADTNVLMRSTINCAAQCGTGLCLSPYCLDATLLYLEVQEETDVVFVAVAGDGIVFGKHKEHGIFFYNIEYPSGSPFYPSYVLDPKRLKKYQEECGIERCDTFYAAGEVIEEKSFTRFRTIVMKKKSV